MNNRDQLHRTRRSQITQRLLIQYLLCVLAFIGLTAFLLLMGINLVQTVTWRADNPLYVLLNWMREYLLLWVGLFLLAGWMGITYYFIAKPSRYLDEIIAASEQLAQPTEKPIILPAALVSVQDELNLVREHALLSARAAKEAEQRKNDLIVYLAHDLKTPLTSIIGYLTLLRDEPQISPEMRARYTGIALDKATRLEDLINEFFDITRFNLTALTLETERVNLSRMLEQIASEFDPILSEKDLRWHLDIAPDIMLLCDPDKLARVFDNLFRNAVNYSYPNTEITLSMAQAESEIHLRVENHGKTIAPDKLARIFDQFFRLDNSRASTTGGAGLGLAIAREIVELHGGSIAAESANERIAFTVRLPMH